MRNVGIFVFPQVEELDFVGPLETLDQVNSFVDGALDVFAFAPQLGTVTGAHGLEVVPRYDLASVPPLDFLVVPGGRGARIQMEVPRVLEFVREQASQCELVASVCTGSLILGAAGLLQGKRATTHHGSLERLAAFEGVEVVQERYVHDGRIITAAGISAGIDMALYMVQLLFGDDIQAKVARVMEYGA